MDLGAQPPRSHGGNLVHAATRIEAHEVALADLPTEILLCIAHAIPEVGSLRSFAVCCRALSAVVDREVWRVRLKARFPHSTWHAFGAPSLAWLATSLDSLHDVRPWEIARALGEKPADRGGHACAALMGGRGFVVHGGANGDVLHGDACALLVTGYAPGPSAMPAFRWSPIECDAGAAGSGAPSARWAHTATALTDGLVAVIGGHSGHSRAPLAFLSVLDCEPAPRHARPKEKREPLAQSHSLTRGLAVPRPTGLIAVRVPCDSAGSCADPHEWRWLPRAPELRSPLAPHYSPGRCSESGGCGGGDGGGSAVAAGSAGRADAMLVEYGEAPAARYAHACAEFEHRLWLFGGIVGSFPQEAACANDLHVATMHLPERPGAPHRLSWGSRTPQGTPPAPRFGHSLTRVGDALWAFAGRLQQEVGTFPSVRVSSDVHCLRGMRHACAAGTLDGATEGMALALPSATAALPEALRWERVTPLGPPPSARAFHAAVGVGGTLLIVGGESGAPHSDEDGEIRYLADLHALCVDSPIATSAPAAATRRPAAWLHGVSDGADGAPDDDASAGLHAAVHVGVPFGPPPPPPPPPPHALAAHAPLLPAPPFDGAPAEPALAGPPLPPAQDMVMSDDDAAAADDAVPPPFVPGRGVEAHWRALLVPYHQVDSPGPPPSSLAAIGAVDGVLVSFGGFNHKPDADMAELHVVRLADPQGYCTLPWGSAGQPRPALEAELT